MKNIKIILFVSNRIVSSLQRERETETDREREEKKEKKTESKRENRDSYGNHISINYFGTFTKYLSVIKLFCYCGRQISCAILLFF